MSPIRRVVVGDGSLAYREVGSGEALLLLHSGFIADAMMPLLEEPSLAGYRKVAYHRRGYQDSDPTGGPRSIRQAAADAVGLLDALGIDRAHVAGHSMGAVVAIDIALHDPSRVTSLALLEPLLGFLLEPEAAAFVAATAAVALPQFAAGEREQALQTWLSAAFGADFRPVVEQRLPGAWEQAVRDTETSFGVELAALQEWPVGPEDLTRIEMPALSVVHSGKDWVGFVQTHDALVSRLPDCRGATVDLGSHLLQVADPTPVAEALSDFLQGHASRAVPPHQPA